MYQLKERREYLIHIFYQSNLWMSNMELYKEKHKISRNLPTPNGKKRTQHKIKG